MLLLNILFVLQGSLCWIVFVTGEYFLYMNGADLMVGTHKSDAALNAITGEKRVTF